jgi:D-threo-aldose 1-dehydrogenase
VSPLDPATRTPLGRTNLTVTALSLGAAPIAGLYRAVGEEQAAATVEQAWQLGIRFFDTAPLYGLGLAERRLGAALAGKPRDEYVVATKVGRLLRPPSTRYPLDRAQLAIWPEADDVNAVFDFSHDGVLRSLEESLERLGLDRVDVVHIHDPDDHHDEALAGAFQALSRLRDEGVIGAVGAGMNQSEMLARFAHEAGFDCFLVAGRYTLLDRSAETDLLPACADRGIGVIAAGVFNSGLLADPSLGAPYDYAAAPPDLVARAQAMAAACQRHGVPLKAAALQFPLTHPAVATVLIGARSPAEIAENASLFQLPLPEGLFEDLRNY